MNTEMLTLGLMGATLLGVIFLVVQVQKVISIVKGLASTVVQPVSPPIPGPHIEGWVLQQGEEDLARITVEQLTDKTKIGKAISVQLNK